MNILRTLLLIIAGFDRNRNVGVIYHDGMIQMIDNSMFISYVKKTTNGMVCAIDENYSAMGSRFFEWTSTHQIQNPGCLGAVFIEEVNNTFYIPCFGSDNIWIVSDQFKTINLLPTCHKPHGIYYHDSEFYVPCRDSDSIHVYDNQLTLKKEIEIEGGPRHLIFVKNDIFVITEFSCQIVKIQNYSCIDHVNVMQNEAKCAEIRYSSAGIMVSVRIENNPGELVLYDLDLKEIRRIQVGVNPRFFDVVNNTIIVLNQDDNNFMIIDTNTTTLSENLGMNPQCFVVSS